MPLQTLIIILIPCFLFFFYLLKKPELALASQFNGTIIYFYLMYKLGIMPRTLITGSFHFFLIVAYLSGGIYLIIKNKQRFKITVVDLLFIFLFVWALINGLLLTSDLSFFRIKLIQALPLVIIPYFGSQFLGLASLARVKKFLFYSCFFAVLITPFFFCEETTRSLLAQRPRFSPFYFEKGGITLENEILTGITFSTALIILLLYILEERRVTRIHYLILIPPFLYFLFRSTARGPIFSLIITFLFYYLFFTKIKTKIKIYFLTVLFIIPLLYLIYNFLPPSVIFFLQPSFYTTGTIQSNSILARLYIWQEALKNFLKNPIFGIGFGNFSDWGWAHNIILEVGMELGIIGLIPLIFIFYTTLLKGFKLIKTSSLVEIKIIFLLFIFSLTEAMFSGHLGNQTYLFLSTGLLWGLIKSKYLNIKKAQNYERTTTL
jgi:O-antigen ligase